MTYNIKAATVTRSNVFGLWDVTINECVADILGIESLRHVFNSKIAAHNFAEELQANLDTAYDDAC